MTDPTAALPERPRLKTGLRRLWRGAGVLQLGLDPRYAVVIEDATDEVTAFLDRLDGTMAAADLGRAASAAGLDPELALALLRRLAGHGVLEDAAAGASARRALSKHQRERLAPDLAAWSIGAGAGHNGEHVLAHRRSARVDVHGAGRVGAAAAALLAQAAIGEVRVDDREPQRAADRPALWPAAPHVEDDAETGEDSEGSEHSADSADPDGQVAAPPTRAGAALDVCEQLVPSLRTGRRRPAGRGGAARGRAARGKAGPPRPTAALLAPVDTTGAVDLELRDGLLRDSVPHLPAYVRETVGVVGPLVVPGRTACLRCLDLSRSERDPAWPRLLAQVSPPPGPSRRRPPPPDPCDGVLATAVAALAVVQLTTWIDGREPAAWGGTLEIDAADGTIRRKAWSPHPACGCHWR